MDKVNEIIAGINLIIRIYAFYDYILFLRKGVVYIYLMM